MVDVRKEFARKLKEKMSEKNIKPLELTAILEVTNVTVYRYLNAESTPSIGGLKRLCKVLECDSKDLLGF